MRKTGMIILVLLIMITLAGCSKPKSDKVQSEPSWSASQKISTPNIQKSTDNQSTKDQNGTNKKPGGQTETSTQLKEIETTLQDLNDVVKGLDDVSGEVLIIPTP